VDRLTGLLVAARDGDDAALTEAVRTAQTDVRSYLRLLVDAPDLDDAVQETFVRTYRSLGRFRAEASGRTWLLSIARRVAADTVRRAARGRRIRSVVESGQQGAPVASPSDEHALRELVGRLAPSRRDAFVLTQLVGCDYAEAAAICAVPVGTIRSRVARARSELLEQVRAARSA